MFRKSLAAAALVALGLHGCSSDGTPGSNSDAGSKDVVGAKNVIFFLGDGMGMTTMTAARIYAAGEDGELTMDTLPEVAFVKTFSKDAQVTDSAPSMSAYMTGVKMNNEVLSMTPETKAYDAAGKEYFAGGGDSTCPASGNGAAVPTILEIAKAAGRSVGAVTTTRITHATPAATFSHVCNRNGENTIADQIVPGRPGYNAALGTGVDVLLGGGRRHFYPSTTAGSKRSDSADLIATMKSTGYTYVSNGSELAAVDSAATTKLLGLFHDSDLNYDLDRTKNAIDEPSLADMTEKAIRILKKNEKGFFLMVEGGRIDHALHGTSAKRAIHDTLAFDDAIKRALSLVDLKDTLVVVTADHDHVLTMNGYGRRGKENVLGLVKDIKSGNNAMAADGKPYTTLVFGNGPNRRETREDLSAVDTTADAYLQETGIRLSSETHGGGDVKLHAGGAGSSAFKGTMDNTRVFSLMKKAAGL